MEQPSLNIVGSPEHIEVVRGAIQKSITVVRDEDNLPLGNERVLVIEPAKKAANIAEDVLMNMGTLSLALRAHGLVHVDEIGAEEHDAILGQGRRVWQSHYRNIRRPP